MSNAAPEWQAGRLWPHINELMEACPLEGLVRLPVQNGESLRHSL
jgi:hypothetical protein